MAIVVEITDKVRIERELEAERKSLKRMFEQAPGFIAMASGPEHRFTMVNEAYRTLVAGRDVVGRTVAEALPEVVEQGFVELARSGLRFRRALYRARRDRVNLQQGPDGALDERYLDFIYQPIVADNGGDDRDLHPGSRRHRAARDGAGDPRRIPQARCVEPHGRRSGRRA